MTKTNPIKIAIENLRENHGPNNSIEATTIALDEQSITLELLGNQELASEVLGYASVNPDNDVRNAIRAEKQVKIDAFADKLEQERSGLFLLTGYQNNLLGKVISDRKVALEKRAAGALDRLALDEQEDRPAKGFMSYEDIKQSIDGFVDGLAKEYRELSEIDYLLTGVEPPANADYNSATREYFDRHVAIERKVEDKKVYSETGGLQHDPTGAFIGKA